MSIRIEALVLSLGSMRLELDATFAHRITGVFGRSGAGKTALLETLAGLRRPARGRIELDGRVVLDRARGIDVPSRDRRVGYVPQEHALFPHLAVHGNLRYGMRGGEGPAGVEWRHVVDVLELAPLLGRGIGALSGGEKQRVALGRALLLRPRLLLLDEPLASLDAGLRGRALDLLRRIQAEFAIPMVYVTHAADEVVGICDDVMVLDAGRAIAHGRPAALFEIAPVPQWRIRAAVRNRDAD